MLYREENISSTRSTALPSTSVTGDAFDLSTGSPKVRICFATLPGYRCHDRASGDHQYFAAAPVVTSATETVRVRFVTPPMVLRTDRGVFSHGRVDAGTEVLLRQGPRPAPAGTYLDLGAAPA